MAPAAGGGWPRPVRRVLSLGLFFVVWHYSTKWDVDLYVRFQNIPTPWEVLEEAAAQLRGAAFYGHILASLERIWLGFAVATVLGISLGLLIGWFRFAEDTLFPPIELLRPIPAVAWVPLSIMLWPTERSSIVYITALGAFFPIVRSTIYDARSRRYPARFDNLYARQADHPGRTGCDTHHPPRGVCG